MKHGSVARLRALAGVLAIVVGASLSVFTGGANAATFRPATGEQLVEEVEASQGDNEANTYVLTGSNTKAYLPTKKLVFTDTSGPQTIEGPAGIPTARGQEARLNGASIEAQPTETILIGIGVTVTLNHIELLDGGLEQPPAIEDEGTLNVNSSLIADSLTEAVLVQPSATLSVTNSTISNGAVTGVVNEGTASFFNSTVAFNKLGGIENSGTLNLTNTIVADNNKDGGQDCEDLPATTSDHSLDSDGTCGVGALSKTNPKLATALANSGGTTELHELEAGSPAIGAGDAATCTTTDQRGLTRAKPCSIGAAEVAGPIFNANAIPGNIEGSFKEPDAVAVDPSGNLWVADSGHDRVLEFNSKREFLRAFGTAGTGAGQFQGIAGIATNSSGDVYVSGSNRVQEFSPTGTSITQFGSAGSGNGQFNGPSAIAIEPSSGNVWVLDSFNYRVQEFSPTGEYLSQFGSKGTTSGLLGWAKGLAFSGANLYVAEFANNRVQEFSTAGTFIAAFGTSGTGNGQFRGAWGIASGPTGNLYVSDIGNSRVEEFSSSGAFVATFGSNGSAAGQLSAPEGVAVNSSGVVYIADTGNNRVEEWITP